MESMGVKLTDPYEFQNEFISIRFQNGLPPEVGINGVRAEDVIDVLIAKLNLYQNGELACKENDQALESLTIARDALVRRRQRRQTQGVYHTLTPHADRTEDVHEEFSATGA
jgi:hypothetical protein